MIKRQTMIDYRFHIIKMINRKISEVQEKRWKELCNNNTIAFHEYIAQEKILKELLENIKEDTAYQLLFDKVIQND